MISFTPLAAGARSEYTQPLAYILEIDDVKVLLDCGSPDWHPEDGLKPGEDVATIWDEYCSQLQRYSPFRPH
jgi:cleavage and polyadenylation specificity factor subunit 2